MAFVQISSIVGSPPYQFYVSDVYGNNKTYLGNFSGTIPPAQFFQLPSIFNSAEYVMLTIVDGSGCEKFEILSCLTPQPTPTPTPSFGFTQTPTPTQTNTPTNTRTQTPTPTNTPTISLTASITPSVTTTPSVTPTNTVTPTVTPTNTMTPGVTPTNTPSPSVTQTMTQTTTNTPTNTQTTTNTPTSSVTSTPSTTPTNTPTNTPSPSTVVSFAYLFIEPFSGSSEIGNYMNQKGSGFYGFTNGFGPNTSNPVQFNVDMNEYVSFTGWTNNFPSVRSQQIQMVSGGLDSFGNAQFAYNFTTHRVPAGTVEGLAWYTWIIATGNTNGGVQRSIGYTTDGTPNSLINVFMDSTIYSKTFTYTGSTIPTGTYRVYTTWASTPFQLDNTEVDIFFKGDTITY